MMNMKSLIMFTHFSSCIRSFPKSWQEAGIPEPPYHRTDCDNGDSCCVRSTSLYFDNLPIGAWDRKGPYPIISHSSVIGSEPSVAKIVLRGWLDGVKMLVMDQRTCFHGCRDLLYTRETDRNTGYRNLPYQFSFTCPLDQLMAKYDEADRRIYKQSTRLPVYKCRCVNHKALVDRAGKAAKITWKTRKKLKVSSIEQVLLRPIESSCIDVAASNTAGNTLPRFTNSKDDEHEVVISTIQSTVTQSPGTPQLYLNLQPTMKLVNRLSNGVITETGDFAQWDVAPPAYSFRACVMATYDPYLEVVIESFLTSNE